MRRWRPVLNGIELPMAVTNGDYNPGNFLSAGRRITGFVDFAGARFEDHRAGFAQFEIYDWAPYNRAGIIERYLEAAGLTRREFAPRMAVRCLCTLRRVVPVTGGAARFRAYLLGILEQALGML